MAKTREQKQKLVDDLIQRLKECKSAVLSSQKGLTVSEVNELRNKCKQENVEHIVVKKTLLNLAFEKAGLEKLDMKEFDGIIAISFGLQDEVTPAKVLFEFSKEYENLILHQGILEGEFISKEKVLQLAKIPSKQELITKFIGSLQAPLSGFTNVLSGTIRGFVQVLDQIAKQKSE